MVAFIDYVDPEAQVVARLPECRRVVGLNPFRVKQMTVTYVLYFLTRLALDKW